jgi:hypothetical protein
LATSPAILAKLEKSGLGRLPGKEWREGNFKLSESMNRVGFTKEHIWAEVRYCIWQEAKSELMD